MAGISSKPSKRSLAVVGLATGALVLGVGGGAVGGALITSKQIKNNTIKSIDVRNGTLTGTDVADGGLTGADLADGSVGAADITDGSVAAGDLARSAQAYFASVNANASVAGNSGGVTAASSSTGIYTVTFPTAVDQCGVVASGGTSFLPFPFPGGTTTRYYATSRLAGGVNTNNVVVQVTLSDDTLANGPFTVAVVC